MSRPAARFPVPDALPDSYKWPLDLDAYDRSPILRDGELAALTAIRNRWGRLTYERVRVAELPPVDRLVRPVVDAAHHVRSGPNAVTALFVRYMADVRTCFWGWSEEDWAAFLQWCYRTRAHPTSEIRAVGTVGVAYLLGRFRAFSEIPQLVRHPMLAELVFGPEPVQVAVNRGMEALGRIGYRVESEYTAPTLRAGICYALLHNCSPRLEDLTREGLEIARRRIIDSSSLRNIGKAQVAVSLALVELGIATSPLARKDHATRSDPDTTGVPSDWAAWCGRWLDLATAQRKAETHRHLLQVGIWLEREHPEFGSPERWTRQFCATFVAAVINAKVGDWVRYSNRTRRHHVGQPLSPRSKDARIGAVRKLFGDLQAWELIPRHVNVARDLATPQSILNQCGPSPRTIDDRFWLKLTWASLNLTQEDLGDQAYYPLELVRAVAATWTLAALRSDEIARLRVGCIRPQAEEIVDEETGETLPPGTVCFLDVPVNKTSPPYTKPVPPVLGEMIAQWEAVRVGSPLIADRKTGERVQMLFALRGRKVSVGYINKSLIPLLCRKADIPEEDARGRITSHRGRASRLNHLKQGMSLFELQQYAGHKSPLSTLYYLDRVEPAQLSRSFAKADRTSRMIDVLLDREAIESGAAAQGISYLYYDLGPAGLCSNPFWSRCRHRMVCPGCDFNIPKGSALAEALMAKAFLQRYKQEVPLTEEEIEAVDEDYEKWDIMLSRLQDVPTPDGRTPREIGTPQSLREAPRLRSFLLPVIQPQATYNPRSRQD